jgi:hypothetical protein
MNSTKDTARNESGQTLRHNSTSPNLPRAKEQQPKEMRTPSLYIPILREKFKTKPKASDYLDKTPSTTGSKNQPTEEDQHKNVENTPTV